MKTPLRLAALALTTFLFVFLYQTRNEAYPAKSIPSRLMLKSRGYLPQVLLGWGLNNDTDATCNVECGDYETMPSEEYDSVGVQEEDNSAYMVEQGIEEDVVKEIEEDTNVDDEYRPQWTPPLPDQEDKIVIMGKMSDEYTDWVEKELPE